MNFSELKRAYDLLLEKNKRHEQILIQAYKSLKQKEDKLNALYQDLCIKEKELLIATEELQSTNEKLFDKNSELQSALRRLQETQTYLIQAEKMVSLGTLTAGIAHEINNPLNYLMGAYVGFSSYLEEYGSSDIHKTEVLLESIKISIERISGIVQGLNQFSRNNKNMEEDCDIHSILDNCLVMLNNKTIHKAEIIKEYSEEQISVKGNVGKLHQAFLNILTNSIQAITDKGKIIAKTQVDNKRASIEISDNGIGIEKKFMKQITDPFFTTKPPGQGTGLGLSITYTIIEEHKGAIEFKSEQNKGTKVIITLPINQDHNEYKN